MKKMILVVAMFFVACMTFAMLFSCNMQTLFSNPTNDTSNNTPQSVDLSTLSKSIAHVPTPADLMNIDATEGKSALRQVYTDPSPLIPTGFMLNNYLANGGFHAYAAIFYGEALAGLKSLGDAPKDTLLDLTNTSAFYNEWFPAAYTQKASWTTSDTKSIMKVTFSSPSLGYLIKTMIEIEPSSDDSSKCEIHIGIHMNVGVQTVNFISDYSENSARFAAYVDVGDAGGGHSYMVSAKEADGSISFGMMNDPYAYYYGYKDNNGSMIAGYDLSDNHLEGSEYTNPAGEYQDSGEMSGTAIPLYRFKDISGYTIGFDADLGSIWVDTNGNGIKDAGEETIPGTVKSFWFLKNYDAGYYYGTSQYLPCIDINAIPTTHTLYEKFIYKDGYALVQKTYLDGKLATVKSSLSLSYTKSDYDARIATLNSETFPE